MSSARSSHELRCFCGREPLLATYGLDEKGKLYLHIKVFKQRRIYGEVVITDMATVRILCRECFRWHKVRIVQPDRVELEETDTPSMVEEPSAT